MKTLPVRNKKVFLLPWLMAFLIVELGVAIVLELELDSLTQRISSSDVENLASQPLSVPSAVAGIEEIIGSTAPVTATLLQTNKKRYIEVIDSCGVHYGGECLVARSAPTTTASVVAKLRTGMVLQIEGEVRVDGRLWYQVVFDEWLRYPERLKGDWYVAADFVEVFYDEGEKNLVSESASTTKRIVIDRSSQTLIAYEAETVFLETSISAGKELTPTPRGTFTLFKKTPTRYMQGPLPYLVDKQVYDLPGVPWILYFTEGGAAIHGTYWHDRFGEPQSHGCVNLSPSEAKKLYGWADVGAKISVID